VVAEQQQAAGVDVAVGAVALVAAGASALAIGTGASLLSLLPILALGGLGMLLLAASRMAWFVLVCMVIRSSLDATKLGRRAPLGLDPAQALALVFLACAAVWLIQRWRSDEWVRLWWSTRFGLFFVLAGGLSLFGAAAPGAGLVELSRIAAALVMLVVLNQVLGRPGARSGPYLAALFLAAVIPVMLGLYQLTTSSKLRRIGGFNRVQATFLHPNPFAIFCGIVFIMALAVFRDVPVRFRIPVGAIGLGAAVCLAFTYTRGAWIAVAVGLVVVGLKHRPGMLVLGIFACVLAYAVVPSISERVQESSGNERATAVDNGENDSIGWRIGYWQEALRDSKDSRITGIGLKAVAETSAHGKQPHNDFVRALAETGVLGLAAFTGFALAAAIETSKAAKRAAPGLPRAIAVGAQGSVVAFIVFALSANVISQVVVLWYLVLVIALGMSAARVASDWPAPDDVALVAS
jgi:hypothetical protein